MNDDLGHPNLEPAGGVIYNNLDTTNGLQFRTNGNITRMVINSAGQVGVKTLAPARNLSVNGSAGKTGGGSWSVFLDRRLKQNVRTLHGALDNLLALRGISFEYIDPASIHESAGTRRS